MNYIDNKIMNNHNKFIEPVIHGLRKTSGDSIPKPDAGKKNSSSQFIIKFHFSARSVVCAPVNTQKHQIVIIFRTLRAGKTRSSCSRANVYYFDVWSRVGPCSKSCKKKTKTSKHYKHCTQDDEQKQRTETLAGM